MTDPSAPPTDAETLDAICVYLAYQSNGGGMFYPAEHDRATKALNVIIRRRRAIPSQPKDAAE